MHKSAISSKNTRNLKTTDCFGLFFTRLKFFKILIGETVRADLIDNQITSQ